MDWGSGFLEFASNLADSMLFAIVPLTAVAAFIGFTSYRLRDLGRRPLEYATAEYSNATWRMWASVQGVLIMWAMWAVFNALPEPNYIYRTETKVVTRNVNTATTYFDVYDKCAERMGEQFDEKERAHCDQHALVLSKPGSVLKVTKTVPQIRYRADPYQALYSRCLRGVDGMIRSDNMDTIEENTEERMSVCHDQAMEVRRTLGISG